MGLKSLLNTVRGNRYFTTEEITLWYVLTRSFLDSHPRDEEVEGFIRNLHTQHPELVQLRPQEYLAVKSMNGVVIREDGSLSLNERGLKRARALPIGEKHPIKQWYFSYTHDAESV